MGAVFKSAGETWLIRRASRFVSRAHLRYVRPYYEVQSGGVQKIKACSPSRSPAGPPRREASFFLGCHRAERLTKLQYGDAPNWLARRLCVGCVVDSMRCSEVCCIRVPGLGVVWARAAHKMRHGEQAMGPLFRSTCLAAKCVDDTSRYVTYLFTYPF